MTYISINIGPRWRSTNNTTTFDFKASTRTLVSGDRTAVFPSAGRLELRQVPGYVSHCIVKPIDDGQGSVTPPTYV
jgi:hypothetical protein